MDRQLLSRATDGSDAPTPGYIYVDLAKAASANPSACQEMAVYLTRRLQNKNNPNIKYKCCKVISKLCDQVPRNQFRRCVAQDASAVTAIKEAMGFRGPFDPVQGDEKNGRVRTAAREALDAVYREAPSSEMNSNNAAMGSSSMSASYAPSPHGGGGYQGGGGGGGMGGPRRMEGIGNPRYTDPRLDPRHNNGIRNMTVQDAVKEAGDVVLGMIKDPLARNVGVNNQHNDVPRQGYSNDLPGYNRSSNYPPGSAELSRQTGGEWTMASNRGAAAVQPPPNYGRDADYYKQRDTGYQWAQKSGSAGAGTSVSAGSVGGSWGNVSVPSSAPTHHTAHTSHSTPSITVNSTGAPTGAGGRAASDGTYEKNLILELCPPGVKTVPPPDKLANFAKIVPSLNSDLVCPVLLDYLEEGQPWVIRAKALCVMETCIRSGMNPSTGANPYRDFFHACQEEVAPLATHARVAIKDPARRVLQLLGVAVPTASAEVAAAKQHPAAAAAAAPPPNLLDFGDDDDVAAPAPVAAPPPPPTQAPPAPPAAAAGAAAPPSAGAGGGDSLFGGMQVKAAAASAEPASAAAVPAPAAPSADAGSLLDFRSPAAAAATDIFRESADEQQQPTANGGGGAPTTMFEQMNLKQEDKKSDSADAGDIKSLVAQDGGAADGGAASSAFGFINASSEGSKDATEQHSNSNPVSFDPLKSMSPSGQQRKMMAMSPEQMQAMAYQQMMMQQQYQHLQMAMAMQQQQKLGGMGVMPPMYPNLGAPGGAMPGAAMGVHPPNPASAGGGFSFANARPAKKDDKKFDFVMDAMKNESQKK